MAFRPNPKTSHQQVPANLLRQVEATGVAVPTTQASGVWTWTQHSSSKSPVVCPVTSAGVLLWGHTTPCALGGGAQPGAGQAPGRWAERAVEGKGRVNHGEQEPGPPPAKGVPATCSPAQAPPLRAGLPHLPSSRGQATPGLNTSAGGKTAFLPSGLPGSRRETRGSQEHM